MNEIEVNAQNFEQEVMKSEKPVVVDFWADWCMPCKMLAPQLEEFAKKHDDIKVAKINVDETPELAVAFDIDSIPALIFISNGEIKKKSVGYKTLEEIEIFCQSD